jgi:hypothetical protein
MKWTSFILGVKGSGVNSCAEGGRFSSWRKGADASQPGDKNKNVATPARRAGAFHPGEKGLMLSNLATKTRTSRLLRGGRALFILAKRG